MHIILEAKNDNGITGLTKMEKFLRGFLVRRFAKGVVTNEDPYRLEIMDAPGVKHTKNPDKVQERNNKLMVYLYSTCGIKEGDIEVIQND